MRKLMSLYEVQPYELRPGIEELVRESEPKFNETQIRNRTNWLYSLAMGAARKEAIKALAEYRSEKLSPVGLLKEEHNSRLLGKHLNAIGKPKPDEVYEAHAIISGRHSNARAARAVLARYHIRIDDPDNGIWLPNFKRHIPHATFPNAPAHRALHTKQYYLNVTTVLSSVDSKENPASEAEIRAVLKKIGKRLVEGRFPFLPNCNINVNNW